jgi:phosphate transport system substrate-binding protein
MKFTKISLVILLVILSVALSAENLTIAGSTTVLPIAQSTAEVFMDNNPGVNISIRGGGSSVGVASLISGAVDIGNASRHAKNKEYKIARERGINLKENIVANDGIALVVNKANNVKNLTIQQGCWWTKHAYSCD